MIHLDRNINFLRWRQQQWQQWSWWGGGGRDGEFSVNEIRNTHLCSHFI